MTNLHVNKAPLSVSVLWSIFLLLVPQVHSLMLSKLPDRLQNEHQFADGWRRRHEPHKNPFTTIGAHPKNDTPSDFQEKEPQFPGMPPMMGGMPGMSSSIDLSTYKNHTGLATLYTDPGNDMDLILDITDLINGSGLIVITALAAKGSYNDAMGTITNLHQPMEETQTTLYKLVVSKDNKTVDVLQPQLTMRTSDSETKLAWDKGVDSPWIGSLKRMDTSAEEGRVVVDGMELIKRGFFVAPQMGGAIESYHLQKVKSYPNNFDVSLTFLAHFGQMSVTFSITRPPEQPMNARVYDDRVPFFVQDYTDLGVHTDDYKRDVVDPRKSIDPRVEVIWRYDLKRLPDNQIRIYVDPSVPKRWHNSFKKGIEGWNDAFKLAGYSNTTIRGVLPSDSDWPKDYDAGDARFSTISWAIDASQVFSMGIAKVDPRSGEILKSDIIMGAGWVRSWLNDLHSMKLTETQDLSLGFFHEELHQDRKASKPSDDSTEASAEDFRASLLQIDADATKKADADSDSKINTDVENEQAALNLLGSCPTSLLAVGLPKESWFDVVEAGLASVVMHETGHILGLRHNFKGSLGVSYECTQNMSCSAEQGLTASIMDYIPMNIPSAGVEKVHLFSPVVGAYDKLAIRYGYMDLPPDVKEVDNGVPSIPTELKSVLEEANQFQNCVDGDRQQGDDPLCAAYDFTSEPLRYYEDQLKLLQLVQQKLLDRSVGPGEPYWQFSDVYVDLLEKVFKMQDALLNWVGGMNVSYVHRPYGQDGTAGQQAVRPISAKNQRKALKLLLEISQPGKRGLIPPSDRLSIMPYRRPEGISSLNVKSAIRHRQEEMIEKLFNASTLKRIEVSKDFGGLGVETFLDDMLFQVFGRDEGEDLEKSTSQDWDLHMFFVDYLGKVKQDEIPESIEPQVLMATKSAMRLVQRGLERLGEKDVDPSWSECNTPGSRTCRCEGRVRFQLGEENWTSAIEASGDVECTSDTFGVKSELRDAVCQCLAEPSARASLRAHLLEMRSKLKKAEKKHGLDEETDGSSDSDTSKKSWLWSLLSR